MTPSGKGTKAHATQSSKSSKVNTRVLGYLNDSDRFSQAIGASSARDTPIVVFFTAEQVAPCKRIKSTFDALSCEFSNMQFYLVDVEEGDGVAQAYEIDTMPTFVMFKNGNEIDRMQGSSESVLKEFIRRSA